MYLKNKAFTLLESLLTLGVVCFLALLLSGSVHTAFQVVQEQVFLLEFESLYKDSQELAARTQEKVALRIAGEEVSNGYRIISLPHNVSIVEEKTIVFQDDGGNSSLEKISFKMSHETIKYQLYIGSGRYKKIEE
ncbi:type II secretion system GspH family protein [Streptococcus suis]|uniref:competence type IV pilus minor pilin ComGD n=1 Tax=Streptococcus parasuis TaxID=1501662 RepID=UPI00237989E7|nr:competence type IV pilus minor pilin ComGD [Streptococcus parasuis]MDG3180160.1 type II secretion system GspH family protein [Streptococcus suis]WDM37384.1 type II secretion system protein [Streptococcus parasuis]